MLICDRQLSYRGYTNRETLKLNSTPIANCIRTSDYEVERAPSGGAYTIRYTDFQLPYGLPPTIGDTLEDTDGITYTILRIKLPILKNYYKCESVDLMLNSNLTQTITLIKAVPSKDSYAAGITNFLPSYSLKAKIIPLGQVETEVHGAIGFTREYICFIADDTLNPNHRDLIQDSYGNYYQIKSIYQRNRIDELPYMILELQPK